MKNLTFSKIAFAECYYIFFVIVIILVYPVLIALAIFLKLLKFKQNKKELKSLKGQVALVTGSARGLGRLLAIELAERGCHVAVVDVLKDLADETALHISQKYHVKAKAYKIDVSDYKQLVELNKSVTRDLGDVTILINNAAILTLSSLITPRPEEIQKMINVNFTAICFLHQIFLPKMKSLNRGHIVNIASVSALITSPLLNVYAATKSAVRSLTSALRIEIMNESKNITATTVMPMFLNTNNCVERLVHKAGFTRLLPLVEGPLVAHYVLESMLNNADEVTIPNTILFAYKLLEFLPASMREYANSFLTTNYLKWREAEDLLKQQQRD